MGLFDSFKSTRLDLEDEKPSIFRRDTTTSYGPNNTGTPSNKANPGGPTQFYQKFIPSESYLDSLKNLSNKSNLLNLGTSGEKYTIFDATNLNVEKPGVNGGIPYKQEKDPTVYPITTQQNSSTRGTQPIQGKAASKFDQAFTPQKTYMDFIKDYL